MSKRPWKIIQWPDAGRSLNGYVVGNFATREAAEKRLPHWEQILRHSKLTIVKEER